MPSDFAREANQLSRRLKRVDRYVKCEGCGRVVKRYPSQLARSEHIFCSRSCQGQFYRGRLHHRGRRCALENVNWHQRAYGVSPLIAKMLMEPKQEN